MPAKNEKNDEVLIYTGGATVRTITREEWVAAGVEDQETVSFDKTNDRRIPASRLSPKARDLLMKSHPTEFMLNEFKIPAPNGE